ncbi:hypothetical protein GGTG_05715 [Gaeumannomyces tritici R3-111a-1]|uniref:Cytochrome P450 n=1 Tax=Gaeumannomyces tritici (strain R3-111a-1) TaxID=644352 RepID=J3NWQ3_GAET3|nr:hypothetical protein GGTG_05715 [Gaeumannomyces tritici R3-111a-1]EJT75785.1 hypothetical protein GGTG_05715 [Gaeumannomyces tritici R3-111a-1]
MPPYHPILGHFGALARCERRVAHDSSVDRLFGRLSLPFTDTGMHYVDLWPFASPLLVVTSAAGAAQVQRLGLGLPRGVCGQLDVVTGGESLLTMTGARWARWRRALGPGFSSGGAARFVGRAAREVGVFRDVLAERAREGALFRLEDLTLRLTLDVIGSVTMGARFQHQERDNPVAEALMTIISWNNYEATMNPLTKYLSAGWLVQWYNGRRMNRYIHARIDEQLAGASSSSSSPCSKSILSLAASAILEDGDNDDDANNDIAADFKAAMTSHIRLFLFAGHDATSTTLVFAYHHLTQRPEWLALVRAEHDAVFGPSPSSSSSKQQQQQHRLSTEPALLNALPRTLAVIKEVLRLHPPSSKMTEGRDGADLVDGAGRVLPTAGCYVWVLHGMVHVDPADWERPDEFLPERWLGGAAYRPFGQGPRSCIGQALAVMVLKVALVMTLRDFDVVPAHDEWSRLRGDGGRKKRAERPTAEHPSDGYPCRVRLRKV